MPLDYDSVQRTVARWNRYAGLAYFHLLVERIDDAGGLGEVEQTRTNRAVI